MASTYGDCHLPLVGSGGALGATLSLGAVNISVNRATGGQEAMSSLFSPHTEQTLQ